MWINEVAPERLAELFHHYQQALMPEMAGKGSEGRGSWRDVSQPEKSRLVAAARLALLELESNDQRASKVAAVFRPAGRSGMGLLNATHAIGVICRYRRDRVTLLPLWIPYEFLKLLLQVKWSTGTFVAPRYGRPAYGDSVGLRRNLLVYGLGGVIVPFIGIKLIDLLIVRAGLA
jgi:hypothetical protein